MATKQHQDNLLYAQLSNSTPANRKAREAQEALATHYSAMAAETAANVAAAKTAKPNQKKSGLTGIDFLPGFLKTNKSKTESSRGQTTQSPPTKHKP